MYDHLIKIQPNREPFLFIDKIVEVNEEKNARTIKYLSKNEWYFKCHWENDPNMPAMLQLETMSQTASLCLFCKSKSPTKLYLTKIESASFRKKIVPEMTIEVSAIQIKKFRNVYSYKCLIRDLETRNLISKSYLDLLWPTEN